MEEKIRLGISSCLLGNKVRENGGHKHDRYVTDITGKYVDSVPVCPEVECGLGIPKEPMHLEGDPAKPRLVTSRERVILITHCTKDVRKAKIFQNNISNKIYPLQSFYILFLDRCNLSKIPVE